MQSAGLLIFAVGLILGSFLNVCIYRLPRSESVVFPSSHCRNCKKSIPWFYNIPLLSYVILRGRCHNCRESISFSYFAVELITAGILVMLFNYFGLTLMFFIISAVVCGLIVASFIDLEHELIPDVITLGGLALAIILSFVFPSVQLTDKRLLALGRSFLGAFAGGSAIYAIGAIGKMIFKKESMGGGDVKLLAMIGAFIGWEKALISFFIAPFFGSIAGIILKIRTKREHIPYGPYLSLAAIIAVFWGDSIINWLFIGGY